MSQVYAQNATVTNKALFQSTVLAEGSARTVHLKRTEDGLYTLVADAAANDDGGSGFTCDLTQAILYAVFFEILGNTDHWTDVRQRLLNERAIMEANCQPIPAHLACDPFGGQLVKGGA